MPDQRCGGSGKLRDEPPKGLMGLEIEPCPGCPDCLPDTERPVEATSDVARERYERIAAHLDADHPVEAPSGAANCPNCEGGFIFGTEPECCGNTTSSGECRGDCAVPREVEEQCTTCEGKGWLTLEEAAEKDLYPYVPLGGGSDD